MDQKVENQRLATFRASGIMQIGPATAQTVSPLMAGVLLTSMPIYFGCDDRFRHISVRRAYSGQRERQIRWPGFGVHVGPENARRLHFAESSHTQTSRHRHG
jgi:hypothetical protein